MTHSLRVVPDDPRTSFTPTDVVDEALIEALADLGVAEQAAQQAQLAPLVQQALQQARQSLEQVRVVLAPSLDRGDDARVMAARGSLILAVPESGVSQRELRRHVGQIRSVGVRLLGVVLVGRRAERMAS